MKRLLPVLLIIILTGNIHKSFSWDSDAAKFFPMAVGNQWSYHFISRGGNPIPCYPNNQYNYIISIVGDTVFNGHRYYKFNSGDRLRIDSTSMNVYRYSGQGECLVDSLLARKNDYYRSCELQGIVVDTNLVLFAGETRRTKNISAPGYNRRIMHGIGMYYYGGCELSIGFDRQLNGCIINGIQYGVMLGVNQIGTQFPNNFSLSQSYPNPFNPVTNIKFDIPKAEFVTLVIFDVLGREVRSLVNQDLSPGIYNYDFDAGSLPSGIYYYRLEAGEFSQTKKMVLIK